MKSLHIRDVPEKTLQGLRRMARLHHRSLQGELRTILDEAVERAGPMKSEPLKLHTVRTAGEDRWSREEIYGDDGR